MILEKRKIEIKKGGSIMKGKMSLIWLLAALAVVGLGTLGKLEAASTDTIQLTVTPVGNYSVLITSADANIAYNFGTVNLNATTLSERRATVTNNGTIVSRWQVSAYQDGATWSLGTSTSADVAVLKALFNSPNGASPSASQFLTATGST